MIKTSFTLFILLLNLNVIFAQTISKTKKSVFSKSLSKNSVAKSSSLDYTFLKTTGTYTDLVGATSLNDNQTWDDPDFIFPIGFDFKLYDGEFDSLDFYIGLGGSLGSILGSTNEFNYSFAPFETDLVDRGDTTGISVSPISYKLDGQAPNRILKVEWKNAGFFGELDGAGTLDYFINFQLWLFETSNKVEYRYGSSNIVSNRLAFDGETGPIVGIGKFDTLTFDILKADILLGNSNTPQVDSTINNLLGAPSDGTIYRFTRNTTGLAISYQQNSKVRTYPNPAFDEINLSYSLPQEAKNASVILYDLLGKEITSQQLFGIEGAAVISLKDLAKGTYLYKVLSSETGMLANGKMVVSK